VKKTCRRCGEEKPATADHFNRKSASPDGLFPICKDCRSAEYAANPEPAKARAQRRREADRPRVRAEYREWWARGNQEKSRVRSANWAAAHRDEASARTRQWFKDHPLEASAQAHAKRARKRGVPGCHTAAEIVKLYADQEGRCHYADFAGNRGCEVDLRGHYHKDHKNPLSRPETHPTNDISNIALTCGPCNVRKHDMTENEFRAFLRRGLRVVRTG
jgi:5-methylcytosine-specific restriction endonuclease McrA